MFTAGAVAQDFSICLRCQSRLSLGRPTRLHRRRQIKVPAHPRAFSSSVWRRQKDAQFASDNKSSPTQPQIRHVPAEHDQTSSFGPPPKLPLGVESLGTPAEVLVMRNSRRAQKDLGTLFTEAPPKPMPPALEGTSKALLHGIDSTRGIVNIDHVCANIDSVYKDFMDTKAGKGSETEQNLESAEEYDGLLSQLLNGFHKKHLAAYWKRSCSTTAADAFNLFAPYSSNLLARTEWCPKASYDSDVLIPPLRKAEDVQQFSEQRSSSSTSKGARWYAEKILQDCWRLQRSPGETGVVAIRLQSNHLKLLLEHASHPFKKMSQAYSVKLDIDREQSLICLEADFSTCGDVLGILSQILNDIRLTRVAVLHKKSLEQDYLKEVESWTSTVIYREKRFKYIVLYLGPEERDLEDVRRLLDDGAIAKVTKPKGDVWINVPVSSTTSAYPKEFGENIPLFARNTHWARFVDKRGRRFESAPTPPHQLQTEEPLDGFAYPDLVINEVHRFLSNRGKSRKHSVNAVNNHWETNVTRWSQMILGQVAFPIHQMQKFEAKLKSAETNADLVINGIHKRISKIDRVFATTLPGMTRALEAADVSLHPVERLIIRMVPFSALDRSSGLTNYIPELEIIVRTHARDKAVQLQAARLILVHEEHDLLLPSQATDLRLMRREYLYCTQTEIGRDELEPSDPCLTAFVEESQLDIYGSQRLQTPNHLQLSIPASSISLPKGDPRLQNLGTIPVDYRLAGIEHRSFVSLAPIGAYTPEYNTIQAGKTGGRREELAIRLGPQADKAGRLGDLTRNSAKGLLEAALQVVRSMR